MSMMRMSTTVGEYRTQDGCSLKYRYWPAGQQADALIYLHGIESHSEWFTECAEHICAMGFSVYALDRRGSGMNTADRGHCAGFRKLIADACDFIAALKGRHERLHLAGLSWGGKLAVAVDILHPGLFSSMTLIAPGIFPRVSPSASEKARIAFDSLFRPKALHPIPIRTEMFTAIPKYLQYIASDPLRLREVTARFYLESFKMDRLLKRRKYQWSAPTQLLIAEYDAIIDNRRLQRMFSLLRTGRKRVLLYEGCQHSLQFEKDRKSVV